MSITVSSNIHVWSDPDLCRARRLDNEDGVVNYIIDFGPNAVVFLGDDHAQARMLLSRLLDELSDLEAS